MSLLDRASLEASTLADLHAIASELSLDGYRRLRKDALIDALISHQGGTPAKGASSADDGEDASTTATDGTGAGSGRRRRGRRGGRGRSGAARDEESRAKETESDAAEEPTKGEAESDELETAEGVVELLPNGSGFLRVSPPEPSDQDVYISAAQVKRCELVTGDKVTGPRRAPHRSERFPSLTRIDTVNGNPASEMADRARFDDLPAEFPSTKFKLGSDDPTLKAFETLTPFGRGSRVTITGGQWAGKSHALRLLAEALSSQDGVSVLSALAGVRPEEIAEWAASSVAPTASVSLAGSADAQDHAVELVVDQAKRLAARGADAVVVIDSLDGLHPLTARKVLAAARNITDGGSLTVIAASSSPLGGETTVIALDSAQARLGKFPALDLAASGTMRVELLVTKTAANAIIRERTKALK